MKLYKRDFLVFGLFFLIVTLQSIYTVASNKLSTKGIELGEIQNQIAILKVENDVLRVKVIQAQSFSVLKAEAQSAGFKEVTNGDYITLY